MYAQSYQTNTRNINQQYNDKNEFHSFRLQEIGTGGLRTIKSIQDNNNWVLNPIIEIEKKESEVDVASPKDNLTLIRKVLFLSIVDLSYIFNVTRPTIYSWLDNVEPKSDIAHQLQILANAVKEIQQLKIPNIGKLIHRPIFDGQSLIDVIKNNRHFPETWEKFKIFLKKELENKAVLKSSGKNTREIRDIVNEYSTLIYKNR
ncbi:TPA: hypothetical protein I8Z55_001129 [Legionella pneumophila]|nr:hypothetical protein [Legionella pneumophila]HAT1965502.1 hypothetical protein [Legionella pneumophila]HAT8317241.1 hypothetical protein [Legionella pneumophila]